MSDFLRLAEELSAYFSEIYYHCHPSFSINLSHQAVRALQLTAIRGGVTVQDVAVHLGCAHNTASEIVRRLADKQLLVRTRRKEDERVVELRVTEFGRKILQEQTGLDVRKLSGVLAAMPAAEREKVHSGFALLLQHLREET
ncbi:MarR family winged helix-turn-helix transcriptional regulator [Effusibacillus pohliae]|uniref:MarR family winged helix-turn-helix transcriptional regulator n=1 Tax=Effusibacillus pohliae TaxID=232270 RepID=UPI0003603B20|nr:MarR family transcriptional regulator [Effusibacillus pohliae]